MYGHYDKLTSYLLLKIMDINIRSHTTFVSEILLHILNFLAEIGVKNNKILIIKPVHFR